MTGNSPEKQPAVRPGLLLVLLLVLGGALYWNFFMQPKTLPNNPTPTAQTITPQADNIVDGNQPEIPDSKVSAGSISNRDLFLPPPLVISARRNKDNDPGRSSQPVWNEPKLISPDQGISTIVKTDENPEKPILKGILGTASTQVIIVRYQNKSYLLKLGDTLSGTEYRVAEINTGSVILLSPKGRLRLDKKERAK